MGQGTFDEYATQRDQLDRVSSRIGSAIVTFVRRVGVGGCFHAEDLRRFVVAQCMVAPGSADRILRDLRRRGILDYLVVSRTKSYYRLTRCP